MPTGKQMQKGRPDPRTPSRPPRPPCRALTQINRRELRWLRTLSSQPGLEAVNTTRRGKNRSTDPRPPLDCPISAADAKAASRLPRHPAVTASRARGLQTGYRRGTRSYRWSRARRSPADPVQLSVAVHALVHRAAQDRKADETVILRASGRMQRPRVGRSTPCSRSAT